MVPTIIAGGITFCVLITLGKASVRQALETSLFWFMWVLSAICVIHPIVHTLIKKEKSILLLLAGLTLLFGILFNGAGKFFGYFFLYELGYYLGKKLTAETEKDFFKLSRGVLICIFSAVLICGGYIWGGEALVLEALYKIPVGMLMTYGICSIFLNCARFNFFALAGRFTLQIYLFQFIATKWVQVYTQSFPTWLEFIIFIAITCVDYCVPALLCSRYKNTAVYRMIFRASMYLFPAQHEKVGR